ncbi:MAG: hypothetical protein K2K05_03990 [Muribaculaceae bacterium]|nr:hypothetical protein [Muribaculaceae bacterium]
MICVLTVTPVTAGAQSYSIIDNIRLRQLPCATEIRRYLTSNPAAMNRLDTLSLAHLSLGADHLRMNEPVMEQHGDGHTDFFLKAEAYKRLDNAGVAWGSAGFTTSKIRNVRWTDCIDYDLIAPYTLGDDKGGDLQTQRYEFGGGYATALGTWTLGVHLSYRAEIAYRDVDPRIRTVVSELKAQLGATHPAGDLYTAGIAAGFTRYDQNCAIDFYNPINDTNTYPLTGLGSWYHRFMGNTNKSSGNEAMGWNVTASLLNAGSEGANVEIGYESYRMEQRLRNFNNITPGYTDNDILTARASYGLTPGGTLVVLPVVSWTLLGREGTENLFGTAAGSSYDKIGSRKSYRHKRMTAEAKCHLQFNTVGGYLTITPGATYSTDSERLIDPARSVRVHNATGALGADFSRATGSKLYWQISLSGDCCHVTDKQATLPGLDLTSPLGQCVEHNYRMLSADRISGLAAASMGLLYGDVLIRISAGCHHVRYDGHGGSNRIFASISTIF